MGLFEWSTPERRKGHQVLPIIPNEIYLHIFEVIAPPNKRLAPEELKILCNLPSVCRFFANDCLPRIFASVEYPALCFFRRGVEVEVKSCGSSLFSQIAKKRPLALALTRTVQEFRFVSWWPCDAGWWTSESNLFAKRCITAMSLMKNIRKLQFSNCTVDAVFWNIIKGLPFLDQLVVYQCKVLRPPDAGPSEMGPKLTVSRLDVVDCHIGFFQPTLAVDTGRLRVLHLDITAINAEDWLPQSAVEKLHLYVSKEEDEEDAVYTELLHDVLMQAPRSLEVLSFSVDEFTRGGMARDLLQSILDNPAWNNLTSIRSLTLQMRLGVTVEDELDVDRMDLLTLIDIC